MTLDELEALAESGDIAPIISPRDLKRLIALCRMQHEALDRLSRMYAFVIPDETIAAYEEFNK